MDLKFARCQLHALSASGVYKPLMRLIRKLAKLWVYTIKNLVTIVCMRTRTNKCGKIKARIMQWYIILCHVADATNLWSHSTVTVWSVPYRLPSNHCGSKLTHIRHNNITTEQLYITSHDCELYKTIYNVYMYACS